MKQFKDLEFQSHPAGDGLQAMMFFENGYGISVVRFSLASLPGGGSYTDNDMEWEAAVLKGTEEGFDLCYNTHITSDVLGHLLDQDVSDVMKQIQELPPVE